MLSKAFNQPHKDETPQDLRLASTSIGKAGGDVFFKVTYADRSLELTSFSLEAQEPLPRFNQHEQDGGRHFLSKDKITQVA